MNDIFREIAFRVIDGGFVNGHDSRQWADSGPHADPFSRLYYIDGGRGMLEYAGVTYRLRPGRYYLFPAHYPILHRPSPGLVQYYVHFTANVRGALSLFDITRWVSDLSAGDRQAARSGMTRIMSKPAGPADALRVQAELQFTVARFLRGAAGELPEGAGGLRRFGAVIEYIHQHLGEKLAVVTLARIASLHPNYFSNLFAESFGVPPREYILRKRMERAQLLLWQTDLSIKEIADATGCEGAPYFSRIFRKRVGMTPREYRRQRFAGGRSAKT